MNFLATVPAALNGAGDDIAADIATTVGYALPVFIAIFGLRMIFRAFKTVK